MNSESHYAKKINIAIIDLSIYSFICVYKYFFHIWVTLVTLILYLWEVSFGNLNTLFQMKSIFCRKHQIFNQIKSTIKEEKARTNGENTYFKEGVVRRPLTLLIFTSLIPDCI